MNRTNDLRLARFCSARCDVRDHTARRCIAPEAPRVLIAVRSLPRKRRNKETRSGLRARHGTVDESARFQVAEQAMLRLDSRRCLRNRLPALEAPAAATPHGRLSPFPDVQVASVPQCCSLQARRLGRPTCEDGAASDRSCSRSQTFASRALWHMQPWAIVTCQPSLAQQVTQVLAHRLELREVPFGAVSRPRTCPARLTSHPPPLPMSARTHRAPPADR